MPCYITITSKHIFLGLRIHHFVIKSQHHALLWWHTGICRATICSLFAAWSVMSLEEKRYSTGRSRYAFEMLLRWAYACIPKKQPRIPTTC